MIAGPLGATCVLLWLARKLPGWHAGWGEPPASDAKAGAVEAKAGAVEAKVQQKV